MSIEYTCSVVPDDTARASLRELLAQEDRYVVVPTSGDGVISLRFADRPERAKWPADIELHLGDGFGVAFHSATREERETLLGLLTEWMRGLGYTASFEEE